MKFNITFLAIILVSVSFGQTIEQIISFGGSPGAMAGSIAINEDGSIIVVGNFNDTFDIIPGINQQIYTSQGQEDIYVLKTDSEGNYLWGFTLGSSLKEVANFVTIDPNNNINIFGYFKGTLDFDPGPNTVTLSSVNNSHSGFFLKLDQNGNFISVVNLGLSVDPHNAVYDSNGNMYLTGSCGSTDLDPGPGVYFTEVIQNSIDVFIEKFTSSGSFLWAKTFGSCSNDDGGKIALSSDQNYIYIAGNIYNSGGSSTNSNCSFIDLDPGPGIFNVPFATTPTSYLTKLSSDGDFIFSKSGKGYACYDIHITSQGDIYTSGAISDVADFDPSENVFMLSPYFQDSYISRFSEDGTFLWVKQLKSIGTYSRGICVRSDNDGNAYLYGYAHGAISLIPSASEFILEGVYQDEWPDIEDIYLYKFNSQGEVVWAELFENISPVSHPMDLQVTPIGDIYCTGYFIKADFNLKEPGGIIESDNHAINTFIVKMNACPNYSIEKYTVCDSFIWIDGITYYESNNTAVYTYEDCDSSVLLDLTIIHSTPIHLNTFTLPTNSNNYNGLIKVEIIGGVSPYIVSTSNNYDYPTSVQNTYISTNQSAGIYDLYVIDQCSNQTHMPYTIVTDTNLQPNHAFIDSIYYDSLGYTMENCLIDYNSIDTVLIDSVVVNGSNIIVVWTIIDSNGIHSDTTEHYVTNDQGEGTYLFQISLYCPTKSTGMMYTVNQAYYITGLASGNLSTYLIEPYTFQLAPNPMRESIRFISDNDIPVTIEILDIQGRIVKVISPVYHNDEISLLEEDKGCYFFIIKNEQAEVSVKKIIKE